jgi:hypothetical protein
VKQQNFHESLLVGAVACFLIAALLAYLAAGAR